MGRLFYFGIVLHIVFLFSVGYIVGLVCPQFAPLFQPLGDKLQWGTQLILWISQYQLAPWVWLAILDFFAFRLLMKYLSPTTMSSLLLALIPVYALVYYFLVTAFYGPLSELVNR